MPEFDMYYLATSHLRSGEGLECGADSKSSALVPTKTLKESAPLLCLRR
jgi:hypothetical protein